MLLLTDFVTRGDPNILRNLGTVYGDLVKTHRFDPFCPFFHAITLRFLVPGRYERSGNFGVQLRKPRQNS